MRKMAALCETQEELQSSVEAPVTSPVETQDTLSVEAQDTSSVETQDPLLVETQDTLLVETQDTLSVETQDTSPVETQDTSPVETQDTSSVETQDTLSVETQDTSSVETQDTLSVETPEASSVETPAMSSVESQEELELDGVVHSLAYCKETRSLLLCDCHNWTIEQFSLSSSGLSMQQQKLWKLDEMHGISYPTSVLIARKMNSILIGCDLDEGIYVLDRNSLQLVKKFAQNMNRGFDHMALDETECSQSCTVYVSSANNDTLTKFDYSSGSMMSEISVTTPGNLLLKDDKLYVICEIEYILVIDKHSLEIRSKFKLSGWSLVGGLCLDERRDICVTARNESNHRILYSFDDGFNVVTSVRLAEFDEDAFVLDMVAADKDFIMLTQELDWVFTMKRIRMKL